MLRSIDRTKVLAIIALLACGCEPTPEKVDLRSVEGPVARPPVSADSVLVEGDLLVIDADPNDGDDSMDLCVDASSSNTAVASISRVRGKCRQFVLLASSVGSARIRFEARGKVNEVALDVVAAR